MRSLWVFSFRTCALGMCLYRQLEIVVGEGVDKHTPFSLNLLWSWDRECFSSLTHNLQNHLNPLNLPSLYPVRMNHPRGFRFCFSSSRVIDEIPSYNPHHRRPSRNRSI
jgi:hypothetical protein